jgi:mono/diheme cytochrome c family protein
VAVRKNAAIVAAVIIVLGIGALTAIEVRSARTFDAPYPAVAVSSDPGVIARGRYLVYGPAACAYCHVPKEEWKRLDAGAELPLAGNHVFRLPFGEFYSSNLTPDADTGIGRRTDQELARVLRHGLRADGRAAAPLMEYQGLSDADLAAIISYLRSRPAVPRRVPDQRLSMLGKAIFAFAYEPEGPREPPPPRSPAGPSVERGEYLANKVSVCVTCHTDRGRDGALVGPRFAGGQRMDVAADDSIVYVSANLTPDPQTSLVGRSTEEEFILRFRLGELLPGTPMPWGAYARMTDDDLRSVFRYLKSLPAVAHDTGPPRQKKG